MVRVYNNIMVLMQIPPSIEKTVLKEYEPMLQSAVYLAQENGVDFGLEFDWKSTSGGVFNRELALNTGNVIGFGLEKYIGNVCNTYEQKEFLAKIKPYLDDKEWLVTASASLYIYHYFFSRMTFSEAINHIIDEMYMLMRPCNTEYTHKVILDMIKLKLTKP